MSKLQAPTSSADLQIRPENNTSDLISMLVGKCVYNNTDTRSVPKFISFAVSDHVFMNVELYVLACKYFISFNTV